VIYGILANIACTAGPVFDTVFYRGSPRQQLFKAGYIGSVLLTALPGVWAVTAWLWTVVTGKKLA
jgi:hypothetical protein